MICFHHSDMDGKCAGAVVYWFYKQRGEDVKCFSINHNEPVPFEKIDKGERVYVVDFSFNEENFNKLLTITDDVIWVDHHISAIEKFKDTDVEKLKGIRRSGEAGCELAWKHFHGDSKNTRMPTMVKMLGRYDVWDFSVFNKEILNSLQEYCKTVNTEPFSKVWKKWLDLEYSPKDEIKEGKTFLTYRDAVWGKFLNSWGFEVDFEGYKCIACNTASVSSEFFNTVKDKGYDILIPFIFDGKNWVASLYTLKKNVDCSKIATKYGGGGHKQAAGFVCKKLPFINE